MAKVYFLSEATKNRLQQLLADRSVDATGGSAYLMRGEGGLKSPLPFAVRFSVQADSFLVYIPEEGALLGIEGGYTIAAQPPKKTEAYKPPENWYAVDGRQNIYAIITLSDSSTVNCQPSTVNHSAGVPMNYTRFIRHIVTPNAYPSSANSAATNAAFDLLKASTWREAPGTVGGQYPLHAYAQPAVTNDEWDAFNICAAYNGGLQNIMQGFVAYRFDLPAAAKSTGCRITALAIRAVADKWNTTGAHLSAFTSDDPAPLTCGIEMRENGFATLASILRSENPADPTTATDKAELLTLPPENPPAAAKYLWLYLSLEDYTAYRGAWVEGGAALLPTTLQITYDTAPVAGSTAAITPAPCALGTGHQLFERHGRLFATHTGNRLSWFKNDTWHPVTVPGTGVILTHLAGGILSLAATDEAPVLLYRLTLATGKPSLTPIHITEPVTAPRSPIAISNNDIAFIGRSPDQPDGVIVCYTLENQLFRGPYFDDAGGEGVSRLLVDAHGGDFVYTLSIDGTSLGINCIRDSATNAFIPSSGVDFNIAQSTSKEIVITNDDNRTPRGLWFSSTGIFFVSGVDRYSKKSLVKWPEGLTPHGAFVIDSDVYFIFQFIETLSPHFCWLKLYRLTPSKTASTEASGYRVYTLGESDLVRTSAGSVPVGYMYPCGDTIVYGTGFSTGKSGGRIFFTFDKAGTSLGAFSSDFYDSASSLASVDLHRLTIDTTPFLIIVENLSSRNTLTQSVFVINLAKKEIIHHTYLPSGTQFSPTTLTFFHENTRFPLTLS